MVVLFFPLPGSFSPEKVEPSCVLDAEHRGLIKVDWRIGGKERKKLEKGTMEAARKGKEELVGEVNYLKTFQVSCLSCRVQNPCRTGPKMLFFSLKERALNRYISNTFLTCKFGYSKAAYPM